MGGGNKNSEEGRTSAKAKLQKRRQKAHDLQSWNEWHLNKCAENRYHKL